MKMLIYKGAKICTRGKNGNTPLSLASQYGHGDIVRLLLDADQVAINARDRNGHTPLHSASQYGHGDVVRLLLDGTRSSVY